MNDYLTKPVYFLALSATLDRWLPKETNTEASDSIRSREAPFTQPLSLRGEDEADGHGSDAFVFDKAGMLARLMDDEDLGRKVAEGFLGDIPVQIEALKRCLGSGDVAGVTRQAHTIKGASAGVGGEALRELAFTMEKAARAGSMDDVTQRMPEMERQFALLKEAMTTFIHR